MKQINSKTRVAEVMRRYPELTDYLLELGLCGCSFGFKPGRSIEKLTLEEAAKEKGLELKNLLAELNRRI